MLMSANTAIAVVWDISIIPKIDPSPPPSLEELVVVEFVELVVVLVVLLFVVELVVLLVVPQVPAEERENPCAQRWQ
jgi:hypothetical protein